MKVSIIIPVRNEESTIEKIVDQLENNLQAYPYEIIFINDFSTDNTVEKVNKIIEKKNQINIFQNTKKGLGGAITTGINKSSGEAICIMMSDLSDSIDDFKKYYSILKDEDIDAVFGSRFINGSKITDYPKKKLVLNRIFNLITKLLFLSDYNDFTNAFKIYKKSTLLKLYPLVSENFNIFLELPLKIECRNFKYEIIPINWDGRKIGKSKFNLKELGSKYIFTMLYCLLEKILLKK